jgi:glycosyltransferase involved in cell wall biosynthesis
VYGIKSKQYLEELKMPAARIVVKRAIVDVGLFQLPVGRHQPGPGGCRVVLFVGRLAREKNLEVLIRVFARYCGERPCGRLRLALVGQGPQERVLRELAQSLDIADRVDFRGSRKRLELVKEYQRAAALILPSTSEPWGLVVNEAMLCGLPVAVSDKCGCCPDLVTPQTGWQFSPVDEESLLAVLFRIDDASDETLAALGQNGAKVSGEYSAENCARIVSEHISRCITGVR